jgi:hypothetical protein
MHKWKLQMPGVQSNEKDIWKAVWIVYREEKINQCLWKIVCRISSRKRYIYLIIWPRTVFPVRRSEKMIHEHSAHNAKDMLMKTCYTYCGAALIH